MISQFSYTVVTRTIWLYSCHDINMKFLAAVTPPSIYHGRSTQKTFWEEIFTGKENLFLSVNMKNVGRRKVRKHKEIRDSDNIITLEISTKFDSLDKIETTYSESKEKLERSGKEVGNRFGFQDQRKVTKILKGKVCHRKWSEKDIYRIIRKFEKCEKLPNEKNRPKQKPTERYFYLSRHLAKFMMISNNLNWYGHGGITKMTGLYLIVNVMNES